MKLHRGRLVDHLQISASDLTASQRFYKAVLDVLGIDAIVDEHHLNADELWITQGTTSACIHLAFQARNHEVVDLAYEAGMAAGGRDNGPPGQRAYHPGYYAAYMLDPDGNNVEIVHHGVALKSADSVEITF